MELLSSALLEQIIVNQVQSTKIIIARANVQSCNWMFEILTLVTLSILEFRV